MTSLRLLRASPGRVLLVLLGIELAAAFVLAGVGAGKRFETRKDHAVQSALVADLQLTDLTIWSAASYCRHPSQADVFSAHAEHPAAPEHFPAGSMVAPPILGVGDLRPPAEDPSP